MSGAVAAPARAGPNAQKGDDFGGDFLPATQPPPAPKPITVGSRGVVIQDMNTLARFAKCVHDSGLAPNGLKSPQAIAVAIQFGLELGLTPMSALQNIAVINGKPGVYGDAAKALVESSGLLEDFDEWIEHKGKRLDPQRDQFPAQPDDTTTAVCTSKRKNRVRPVVTRFSVSDAKKANLWGKTGPWQQYPGRMLMFRARGFNLRDNFPDVLKGFCTVEELSDYPVIAQDRAAAALAQIPAQAEQPLAAPETPAEEGAAPPQPSWFIEWMDQIKDAKSGNDLKRVQEAIGGLAKEDEGLAKQLMDAADAKWQELSKGTGKQGALPLKQ